MITDGSLRRQAILQYLKEHTAPVNGTQLAQLFGVSRQVIVQDIALLRAQTRDIIATNRGYLLRQPQSEQSGCTCAILVQHSREQTLQEMSIIVEYGGQMLDVFIDHDLYGQIRADLLIQNLKDAQDFCRRMENSQSRPLKELTGDSHYHTIWSPSEKVMKLICEELRSAGILVDAV